MTPQPTPEAVDFLKRVRKDEATGCWIWTGDKSSTPSLSFGESHEPS